jgi:hypothetical protein
MGRMGLISIGAAGYIDRIWRREVSRPAGAAPTGQLVINLKTAKRSV